MMKQRKGISLVEAMVSLALLSMAIVGSLTTYPMLARMSRSTRLYSQALYYAQAKADELLMQVTSSGVLLAPLTQGDTDYVGATGSAIENGYIDNDQAVGSSGVISGYASNQVQQAPGQFSMTRSWFITQSTQPTGLEDIEVLVQWTDTSSKPPASHMVRVIVSIWNRSST